MPRNNIKPQPTILDERKKQRELAQKKARSIFIISVLVLVLVSLLAFASTKTDEIAGFVNNSNDPISKTIRDVGNNANVTPTFDPLSAPLDLSSDAVTSSPTQVLTINGTPIMTNAVVNIQPFKVTYNTSAKIGQKVVFYNNTQEVVALFFSDSSTLALQPRDEESMVFWKAGEYTFNNELDPTEYSINGKISVK